MTQRRGGRRDARNRSSARGGGIVEALEAKLAEFPEDDSLVNGETWL